VGESVIEESKVNTKIYLITQIRNSNHKKMIFCY